MPKRGNEPNSLDIPLETSLIADACSVRMMGVAHHPDYNPALLSEVLLTSERGHWQVFLRYDGQHYGFGTFLHYTEAQHACTASALEKALSSPELRALCQVEEAERF